MSESTSVLRETPALPRSGDVVAGRYRLIRPLGQGAMGVVFEAVHMPLARGVAIKFLRPHVLRSPHAVGRFEREARASGRMMRSRHIVPVLEANARGRPYMVMELLRGRDLQAELRQRGALPIGEAVDWVLQACAGVGAAHRAGIVHRDLKPSNLFLSEEGRERILKVLDFGISKSAPGIDPAVTSPAVSVGTPIYMSPEQVRSSKDVDRRADVWSLGVILYELIAGSQPFLGTTTAAIAAIVADATPSLRAIRPEVPEELDRAILTALAKAREDRFPSTEAFGAVLVPFASQGALGVASLHPSREAYEVATAAMARAPAGHRASDSAELLDLPTARTPLGATRRRSRRGPAVVVAATVAIGLALTRAATLSARVGLRETTTEATVSSRLLTQPRTGVHVASAPPAWIACPSNPASNHADCLNPSGSSGGGGRSIRRSSDP
jgi:serine/threonine-protein kinase